MRGLSRKSTQASEDHFAWRIARLREGGLSAERAAAIARDGRYDLHALLALVDRGCPAELAARIVAPLDTEGGPGG
jgi:hypothetical protein